MFSEKTTADGIKEPQAVRLSLGYCSNIASVITE